MSAENFAIPTEVRALLDAYLDAVDLALLKASAQRSHRAGILRDLEIQLQDMLRDRCDGRTPTAADAAAVLRAMDAPEAYVQGLEGYFSNQRTIPDQEPEATTLSPKPADSKRWKSDQLLHLSMQKLLRVFMTALVLGLVGAVVGGAAGWIAVQPKYTSVGMIEVQPTRPGGHDLVGQPIYMFKSFVQAQVAQLKSRRVLDDAMNSDEWQGVEVSRHLKLTAEEFTNALEIEHDAGQEEIFVKFVDRDPHAAMIATKQVIAMYMAVHHEQEARTRDARLSLLNEELATLQMRAAELRRQIKQIAEKYGTDDLQEIWNIKKQETQKYLDELQNTTIQLAAMRVSDGGRSTAAPTTPPGVWATPAMKAAPIVKPEDVAPYDADVRQLVAQMDEARAQITRLRQQVGEEHRAVVDAKAMLAAKEAQLHEIMTTRYAQGLPPGLGNTPDVNSLHGAEKNLQQMADQAQSKAMAIGADWLKLKDLRDELQGATEEIKSKTDLINQANAMTQLGGIVTVGSNGDEPFGPSNRKARIQLSVLGAFLFGALGFGSVLAYGLAVHKRKSGQSGGSAATPPAFFGAGSGPLGAPQ